MKSFQDHQRNRQRWCFRLGLSLTRPSLTGPFRSASDHRVVHRVVSIRKLCSVETNVQRKSSFPSAAVSRELVGFTRGLFVCLPSRRDSAASCPACHGRREFVA